MVAENIDQRRDAVNFTVSGLNAPTIHLGGSTGRQFHNVGDYWETFVGTFKGPGPSENVRMYVTDASMICITRNSNY